MKLTTKVKLQPNAEQHKYLIETLVDVDGLLGVDSTGSVYQGKSINTIDVNAYGDASHPQGDHSAADLALCSSLSVQEDNNFDRIERLFRLRDLCHDTYEPKRAFASLLDYAKSAAFVEDAAPVGGTEKTRKVYAAILKVAIQTGKFMVMGYGKIAEEAGVSKGSIRAQLEKLGRMGRIMICVPRQRHGAIIVRVIVSELNNPRSTSPVNNSVLFGYDLKFYAAHLADGAFARSHWTHTRRREAAGLSVEDAFGEASGLVIERLAEGPATRRELADELGLEIQAVGKITRALEDAAIITVAGVTGKTGRTKIYALMGDIAQVEDALDVLRPSMKTAGMAQVRGFRIETAKADGVDNRMRLTTKAGTPEWAKMEAKREEHAQKALAYLDSLLAMGIDPRLPIPKVESFIEAIADPDLLPSMELQELVELDPYGAPDVPKMGGLRYGVDLKAEWVDYGRRVQEVFLGTSTLNKSQRYHLLKAEGYTEGQIGRALSLLWREAVKDGWIQQITSEA